MDVRVRSQARELTVYLKGELDHHGAKGLIRQVEHEIEMALPMKTVLDFSEVDRGFYPAISAGCADFGFFRRFFHGQLRYRCGYAHENAYARVGRQCGGAYGAGPAKEGI